MNTILLFKDGNQVCALLGENLQEGVAGFGNNASLALKDLIKQIDEEGLSDEIASCLAESV